MPRRTALVIPSLGAPHLERCLDAVAALEPTPDVKVLALSGGAVAPGKMVGSLSLQSPEVSVNPVPGLMQASVKLWDWP